jgi:hypothetical protein
LILSSKEVKQTWADEDLWWLLYMISSAEFMIKKDINNNTGGME